MKLFQIFSTNRAKLFAESVDKLLNTVDTALILFKEGVRSYLYNDAESFSQTLSAMATAETESPSVPTELKKEFVKLAELATMAAETTIPGTKAYFTHPDQVSENIHRVYLYDKQAVKLSQSIKRTVFHEMNQLKLSEKFHLRYFALHIEDLSTAAVKVAEQLSVMSIKRSL